MGIDYTLYHPSTCTCFSLGKYVVNFEPRDKDRPFQENRVAAFLATRPWGEFLLVSDAVEEPIGDGCTQRHGHGHDACGWREVTIEECETMMSTGKTETLVRK